MKTTPTVVWAALAALLTTTVLFCGGCSNEDATARQKDADLIVLQRAELERKAKELAAATTEIADLRLLTTKPPAETSTSPNSSTSPPPPPLPEPAPAIIREGHLPYFTLFTGRVKGQANMDAIWIMEHSTSRLIAVMFNGNNDKLEIIAGREVARDVASPARRATPPDVTGNTGAMCVRCGADEDCFVLVDNSNYRLLIYKIDLAKKRVELVATEDLRKLFELKP
ncbi:MAG: hypothetical protein WD768_19540 [Phycisphaeraceae bacterium]